MDNQTTQKFDNWNEEKKRLHEHDPTTFYVNPQEIWFVKLWVNIGFEENGKDEFRRPVLVLKKVWTLFFVVALTTKGKEDNKFYHKLQTATFNENNQKHKDEAYCILSQVKAMDKKRFSENIRYVPNDEFNEVKEKLRGLIL